MRTSLKVKTEIAYVVPCVCACVCDEYCTQYLRSRDQQTPKVWSILIIHVGLLSRSWMTRALEVVGWYGSNTFQSIWRESKFWVRLRDGGGRKQFLLPRCVKISHLTRCLTTKNIRVGVLWSDVGVDVGGWVCVWWCNGPLRNLVSWDRTIWACVI